MVTEAQKAAKKRYRDRGKRLTLDFYPAEAALIAHIERQEQKQTYIKALIRADMEAAAAADIDNTAIF